jgi:hypothetical protein
MKPLSFFLTLCTVFILVAALSACNAGKRQTNSMMVGTIKGTTPDEAAIYRILDDLKNHISNGEWDEWLALYSDDAILTDGLKHTKQVSKEEMRILIEPITFVIDEMEVLDQTIGPKEASVSVRMTAHGIEHFETYKLKKFNGKWLIVEEINP